ncbi:MAG TPA: Gfo/Idh/MocA family oxidoreductase [Gemmataceae bacterium]|jgi:predicted dehydrogenase
MSTHKTRLTRRHFVQGAAAAALTLPIRASAVAGADDKKTTPASDRITLGFIGVGTQNRGHLGHFLGQGDVQVLAVCDVDTNRRDNAKKTVEQRYGEKKKSGEYKGCAAYNDFRELLARKDIDAVVIATPDHWHAIPVIEACRAGMDIYCEKPLSLTIHEAKTMRDAVRKYARVFQTGSQQRSDKEFRLACELVRSGRIGKLKTVYVNVGGPSRPCDLPEESAEPGLDWDRWLGPAPRRPYNSVLSPRGVHKHFPNWRNYREYSGGMMTDWGAHHFDIAQWGLGMDDSGPVEIIPPEDAKAEKGLRYVYANGVVVLHADKDDAGKNVRGLTFAGSDGKVFVDRGYLASDPADIIKQPLGVHDVRLYKSPGHQRDWIECVRSRRRPLCDVEIGARSVTVCHLGNLAYWNHRKLRWDPEHWHFVGDSEADKWLDRARRDPWQLPTV